MQRKYFFLGGAFLILACATAPLYYRQLEQLVNGENYSSALAMLEEKRSDVYGEKDILLYYLDRGFLEHLDGRYAASNDSFERAKQLSDEYFTKSVTAELASFLVSDNVRPYYGEDFERALVNSFGALNYVFLDKYDDALVEARQADAYLTSLQTKYGFKNVYKEDVFARYLSGIIYEARGEINDAYISYWQALKDYRDFPDVYGLARPPQDLIDRVYYWAKKSFRDDVADIRHRWGNYLNEDFRPEATEIVAIGYLGVAPVKIDNFFEISFGKGWLYVGQVAGDAEVAEIDRARSIARSIAAEEQIRLAFPKYTNRFSSVAGLRIQVAGKYYPAAEVEDIGAVAEKSLADHIGRIYARTIARAAIKYALSKEISSRVEKQNGRGAGLLAGALLRAVSTATELADKRCWQILPGKIVAVRIPIAPGTYNVSVDFLSNTSGVVMNKNVNAVVAKKGQKKFLLFAAIM
jgi:hypothetical protein